MVIKTLERVSKNYYYIIRGENMADNMTDKQFEKILKMVEMILDGCKDLDEAKAKVKELTEDQKKEKSAE